LTDLRAIGEETSALELLIKQHPDVSKAVQNYVRLANDGHTMEFRGIRGAIRKDLAEQWEDFASRCNPISNAGLDGVIDQLHKSAVTRWGMGIEVEPNETLDDLVAVHVLDPTWWDWEKVNNKWRPYQYQSGGKVYIDTPNFFYCPTDPDVDDPRGNLMLSSAIFAIDTQLQALSDVSAVIHKVGYPREDITLEALKVIELAKSLGCNSQQEIEKFVNERIGAIGSQYANLAADSTFVHLDDIKIDMTKSANERGGVDVRAVNEFLDIFVLNGLGQMGVFQNRTSGITETWGTVQLKIFMQVVDSFRRSSKRLIESAARQWLRVRGIQAIPKFQHNPIDWETEETRMTVKRLEQAYWRMNQLMGWSDKNEAAQKVVGHDAKGEPKEGATNGSNDKVGDDNDTSRKEGVQRQMPRLQSVNRLR
jgi:hypothetical protein